MSEARPQPLAGTHLVTSILQIVTERKALDLAAFDVTSLPTLCDYYVICSGNAPTHVRAIGESLVEQLKHADHTRAAYTEGIGEGRWAVLDYVDVIVHVMTPQMRDYYGLEELWRDGRQLTPADIPALDESQWRE